MFSFFKRKASAESTPTIAPMSPWELSEEDQLLEEIGEYTYAKLEKVGVDLEHRKFIWKKGKALSIDQVAQRLHTAKPHMPVDDIEDSVTSWLEEAYLPDDITDGDEEERILMQVQGWLEAHEVTRQISESD